VEEVTVFAPGSASNLGPGFDCLGVAVAGRGDRITARRAGAPGVRVRSVSDPRIPLDSNRNTAAIAAAAVVSRAAALGRPAPSPGLELEIVKGLPLAGGLGGSAASAVAGAVAADRLLGTDLSSEQLLEAALEAETVVAGRHADNVAPSLLGGAVLVLGLDPPALTRVRVHADLVLVLATPAYAVETARAREVLPREVPRSEAVSQAARLAGFLLGLEVGDRDLIRRCMVDGIAEPARAPLYPGYGEARAAALRAGAMGVAVSGAGPTVIALADPRSAEAVAAALVEGYRTVGFEAVGFVTAVDAEGARAVV
jgi:homoserine kinase